MKARMLLRAVSSAAVTTVILALVSVTPADATAAVSNPGCPQVLVAQVGPTLDGSNIPQKALPEVAAVNDISTTRLTSLLAQDPTAHVDECGHLLFQEPIASPINAPSSPPAPEAPTVEGALDATGGAFTLNSRPGATKTLYLDFLGYNLSASAWKYYFTLADGYNVPPFTQDSDSSTAFSTSELDAIRNIWLQVSEDYAPFDINVTTQVPDPSAIDRTNSSDNNYGTIVAINSDPTLAAACSCGGIAYTGIIGAADGSHSYYQPAMVFTRNLGNGNTKYVAEAASHEAGHTFGLYHDGVTGGASYYGGQGVWAPIMGVSYSKPLGQWSKGEYAGANNSQDDIAIIAQTAAFIQDESNTSQVTAFTLNSGVGQSGVISGPGDYDWFSFQSQGGATNISVTPQTAAPDLDIALDIYNSNGDLVGTYNPQTPAFAPVYTTTTGLDASASWSALPNGTYYARVSGTGQGDPTTTGYSNYSSFGRYTINETTTSYPQLAITSSTLPSAVMSQVYPDTQIVTTGGSGVARTWSITSGALPSGITLSNNGVLSGTSTVAGQFNITVNVNEATTGMSASKDFLFTSNLPLAITTYSLPIGAAGHSYSAPFTYMGGSGESVTWTMLSSNAPGLSISAGGVLSGTPNAAGFFVVDIQVQNDITGYKASTYLNVNIVTPVSITTSTLQTPSTGVLYNQNIVASGGYGSRTWAVSSGNLPTGLSLNASTGTISGTPTVAGTYNFTLRVTDSLTNASRDYSLTAYNPVSVFTSTLPNGGVNHTYTATVTSTGGAGAAQWAVTAGALPTGISLNPQTGELSGTPTTAGSYSFTLRATDPTTTWNDTHSYSLTISGPLSMVTTLPTGVKGTSYGSSLGVTGGQGPYLYAVSSGALPLGLTLGTNGSLAGIPTTSGVSTFSVTVTDSSSSVLVRGFTITIYAPLVVTTSSLGQGTLGAAYSTKLTATGGDTGRVWKVSSGSLPTGLTLTAAGTLSGKPTKAGTYTFTVGVRDTFGHTATKTLTLTATSPLVVTTTAVAKGTHGKTYTKWLLASGGWGAKRWMLSSGTLPKGVTLTSTGRLAGTPKAKGTYRFTVKVIDAAGRQAWRTLTLGVL